MLILDGSLLRCFADFIGLYLDEGPGLDEIRSYIEKQFMEKGIAESYNSEIITQDEVCSFISSHLYTKFVLNKKGVRRVDDREIKEFYERLKGLLFN